MTSALAADVLVRTLVQHGVKPFIGVPDSVLAPFLSHVAEHYPDLYMTVANEGEAVAIAAGLQLAGSRPCVFLQNSGLGNAVNPLTSLCHALGVPMMLIIGWRGRPGRRDEPQHELMGSITEPILSAMQIAHSIIARDEAALERQVSDALAYLDQASLPFAMLVPRESIASPEPTSPPASSDEARPAAMRRHDAIRVILSHLRSDSAVVSTTGMTSRELERDWDRSLNLYVVGSMGCASSTALGVALGVGDRRPVVVLDGDGAALMRLEALATVGRTSPANLAHFVLDNGVHDSTGGQPTGVEAIDLVGIALACGYKAAFEVSDEEELTAVVSSISGSGGPVFVRVRISPGSDPRLGRPALGPRESSRRFKEAIANR